MTNLRVPREFAITAAVNFLVYRRMSTSVEHLHHRWGGVPKKDVARELVATARVADETTGLRFIEELIEEGHVYTVFDEDHVAATTEHMSPLRGTSTFETIDNR